jgi:CBS-domain-containing membrane protein
MKLLAEDLMTRNVLCVFSGLDLRDLTKLLLDRGVTGAPVTSQDGTLLGVVSQTDLLRYHLSRDAELVLESDFYDTARMEGSHLPRGFQIMDTGTAKVSDVMTPVIYSVKERTPIEDVARLMREKHVHRIIVERGRKAVGLISALDLIAALFATPRARRTKKK